MRLNNFTNYEIITLIYNKFVEKKTNAKAIYTNFEILKFKSYL